MAYNRYACDREKRVAPEAWARVLIAIPDQAGTSVDVVPFVARRRRVNSG